MGYVYIDEAKKRQGIWYMNPERENPVPGDPQVPSSSFYIYS